MNKEYILAPSVLSADFSALGDALQFIEQKGGDWVHIDVMDGHFVPNLTFGPPVIAALRKRTSLPFDVHLMTSNPAEHFDSYIEAGADYLTFHIEAEIHAHRLISRIHEAGRKAGISLVPSTPVSSLKELLPLVDLILVMTVDPGFGGQSLIPSCLEKVRELKKLKQENDFSYIVSVDGGVNSRTLDSALSAGSDVIVTGSAFFSGNFPV
ncbi:ribulose-phosphate 3-epimerase [Treponema zuelzerae]|uniref:Ribulose-phosphate 3-epimerase n=1 Tax=Teretinema zuelzerae TaxID=156 RepID=A0AAE3EJ68_9SPIR|nr:ribulose-phosphate 3-epimerase [Teretinema zuelzerae]MCD1654756.1 ribulose-phosphate 3-epimerase [Teretinema zuelzerae]